MASIGILPEGDWNSFFGMSSEEGDIMSQLLGSSSSQNEHDGHLCFTSTPTFWPNHESTMNMTLSNNEGSYYYSQNGNAFHFPQGKSSDSSFCSSSMGCENYYVDENNSSSITMRIFPVQELQMKRKFETPGGDTVPEEKSYTTLSENSELIGRDIQDVAKNKKGVVNPKRKRTLLSRTKVDQEEQSRGGFSGPSSSSCSSEDYSSASQEPNGGATSSSKASSSALNLNGKARACRGSATDPQSIYARKRRERINERLRILQNLVPNGTKVDISTMLEEAVEYVKFLQLQIKLLSSDEHWMYAPLAYNGMDIGVDIKLSQLQ